MNMKNTLEDFGVGNRVNVQRWTGDVFNCDFTGTVVNVGDEFVTVKDQDGDCWSCEPSQLVHNSDDYMH